MHYDIAVRKSLLRPVATVAGIMGVFLLSLCLFPLLGTSFFPRTDPGQFVINVKAPSGTRLEVTDQYIARVEAGHSLRDPARDLRHDRLEYRHHLRIFRVDLHQQLRRAHGLCPRKL